MDYISIDSSQDIIEHYGIKGMKWGSVNFSMKKEVIRRIH